MFQRLKLGFSIYVTDFVTWAYHKLLSAKRFDREKKKKLVIWILGSSEKNLKNSTVNGDSNPEFCDAEAAVLL